jgi:hypothetical protein
MFGLRQMRSRPAALPCTGILVVMLGTAAAAATDASAVPTTTTVVAAVAADCRAVVSFDRGAFPRHPKIDNKFLPLRPGRFTVVSGSVLDENGQLHAHQILATVSSVTKVLHGVRTVVVFERDYQDGVLQESELAFEAQDKRGTVWNVGEYPEEYEDGALVGAESTWIAGIARAKAGVNMLSHPRAGTPAYLQGVAPSVAFRDCAQVTQTRQRVCVPVRCFTHVLVTDEWAPLDPDGGHQLKYYAPGVGSIRVGAVGGAAQEVLALTHVARLGPAALAKTNAAVLKQDRRGYRVSPHVYGRTPRAELGTRHGPGHDGG